MSSFTFIHFGANNATQLPSFDGLINLKALALALFVNMKELPSFRRLHSLERLVMAIPPEIDSIPDMAPLKKLQSFVTSDRGMFCGDGFAGVYNLAHSMCQRHLVWESPPATCLPSDSPKLATAATRAAFANSPMTVCADGALKPGTSRSRRNASSATSVEACIAATTCRDARRPCATTRHHVRQQPVPDRDVATPDRGRPRQPMRFGY